MLTSGSSLLCQLRGSVILCFKMASSSQCTRTWFFTWSLNYSPSVCQVWFGCSRFGATCALSVDTCYNAACPIRHLEMWICWVNRFLSGCTWEAIYHGYLFHNSRLDPSGAGRPSLNQCTIWFFFFCYKQWLLLVLLTVFDNCHSKIIPFSWWIRQNIINAKIYFNLHPCNQQFQGPTIDRAEKKEKTVFLVVCSLMLVCHHNH